VSQAIPVSAAPVVVKHPVTGRATTVRSTDIVLHPVTRQPYITHPVTRQLVPVRVLSQPSAPLVRPGVISARNLNAPPMRGFIPPAFVNTNPPPNYRAPAPQDVAPPSFYAPASQRMAPPPPPPPQYMPPAQYVAAPPPPPVAAPLPPFNPTPRSSGPAFAPAVPPSLGSVQSTGTLLLAQLPPPAPPPPPVGNVIGSTAWALAREATSGNPHVMSMADQALKRIRYDAASGDPKAKALLAECRAALTQIGGPDDSY